jgi:hypothetical protein
VPLGIETSYDLRAKHRELLTVLDRHDEAIQNEWSHFTQVPAICSYTWRIMNTLRQNVGDGNFHYPVGLRS